MEPVQFLSVDVVIDIHSRIIDEFGGDQGLRDRGFLESAVAMPQSTFGGEFLHQNIGAQAAAYHFHLCSNHAFIDGNKRVAVAASEVFLLVNGLELAASDDEVEEMTLGVANRHWSKQQVIDFFERHIIEA